MAFRRFDPMDFVRVSKRPLAGYGAHFEHKLKTLSWALDPYVQGSSRCLIGTALSRILTDYWSYFFLFPQAVPLSFPVSDTIITQITQAKDLGVTLDCFSL